MTILYADDDQEEIDLLRGVVQTINPAIQCKTVTTAEQALKMLKVHPLPDLIVLDYHMPRMNGMECLRLIKANESTRHLPVVIYSTTVTKTLAQYFTEAGAFRILNKSTDIVKLSEDLKSCFTEALQVNKNASAVSQQRPI